MLSGDDVTMKKKRLMDIISDFDLAIVIQVKILNNSKDFFAPLFKKDINPNDDIDFVDFCSLFKSNNSSSEIFLKTFTSSINNSNTSNNTAANFNNYLFPIEVKGKNKLY